MRFSQTSRIGGAGLLALVSTYGIGRQAYGMFVPSFREEFGLSLDVLGFSASAAQAGYLAATVLTGALTSRFGPRLPVVTGCLLLALGAAMTAAATAPLLLVVGVTLAGTSAGGTWGPFSDAAEYQVPSPGRRRALALVNAGSPIGLVVASGLVLMAGDRWRAVWWGFAAVGLLAAAVAWKVLSPNATRPAHELGRPPLRWFVNSRSVRLFIVTLGASITSGAYFVYAPDTAQDAGLAGWTGPAMFATLGTAGAAVGVFGDLIADRYGLRGPLAVMLVLLGGSTLVLLLAPGALVAALGSAALFGVGFTTGFALVAMWSQQVFHDRPTTGFTIAIVFTAVGFIIGPSLFGVLTTRVDRSAALLVTAIPALLAALVSSPRVHRLERHSGPEECGDRNGWLAAPRGSPASMSHVDGPSRDGSLADRFADALRALEERSDSEPLIELYDDDCVVGNIVIGEAHRGREGAGEFWAAYRDQFDTVSSSFRLIAGDDRGAVLEWETSATAREHDVAYRGVTVLEFDGDRIARSMAYYDPADLGRQLVAGVDE